MSISPISSPINNTQTESDPNYLYKVCGNKASGTLSCKIFFHRNSFRSKVCILYLTINIDLFFFFSFFRIFVHVTLIEIVKLQYYRKESVLRVVLLNVL